MRVGYLGARSDSRGLAYQSQGFCKHLRPARVLGVDMTTDNLSPYPCDWSPFANDDLTVIRPAELTESTVKRWMKGLDVVLGAETFYKDEVVGWAKESGVRTVLQINPEFAPWFGAGPNDPKPDILITPTTWRLDHLPGVIHLPFPVDRALFPFRLRTTADHFVHVAGHRAMADRAGTRIVIGLLARRRDALRLTIRTQSSVGVAPRAAKQVSIENNITDPSDLYADADVVLLPRRYGGQYLVANEALSSGCPVITLDRDPENTWPGVYTVSCRQRRFVRTKGGSIPVFDASTGQLLNAVQDFQRNPDMVERLSSLADQHAQSISWETLHGPWMDLLTSVADGRHPHLLRGTTSTLL